MLLQCNHLAFPLEPGWCGHVCSTLILPSHPLLASSPSPRFTQCLIEDWGSEMSPWQTSAGAVLHQTVYIFIKQGTLTAPAYIDHHYPGATQARNTWIAGLPWLPVLLVDVCDISTLTLAYFSRHMICFWKFPILRKAKWEETWLCPKNKALDVWNVPWVLWICLALVWLKCCTRIMEMGREVFYYY